VLTIYITLILSENYKKS